MIKTIYILWFQGFENAPELVKNCINSWKYYNSDWTIILLDNTTLSNYIKLNDYIADIYLKQINNTALSDIVRIILLKLYGGLWVDATTFCNKQLNDWLPKYINEGFFAFDRPGPDRLLSSWFLYAEKDNYIIKTWYNKTLEYYKINNKPHTYFWFHYLFGDLYTSDNTFKKIWDTVPKLSATGIGPQYLHQKGLFNNITNDIKQDIDDKITPLYKLTYKCQFKKYDIKLNLYYLFSSIYIIISFIHIGKTGGTTINKLLNSNINNYKEYHFIKDYNNDEKYIIWIRNPISRFVSAFNHSFYGIHTDIHDIKQFDLEHCLMPGRMLDAKDKPFVFSQEYDTLFKQFKNANELAESLTSENINLKNFGYKLMNSLEEHIYKGIGWYLNNGNFVKNRNNRILFVGKQETMVEDIKALGLKLNITLNENLKLRENVYVDKKMKYLSEIGIRNIINFYKDTDYAALEQLYIHGWISIDTLNSYYLY